MRRAIFALVCALLLSIGFLSPASVGAQQTSLTIAVSCTTDPERITITNNLATTLNVAAISSIDDPRPNEPFTPPSSNLPFEVAVGGSITYTAGSNATSNVLTNQNIFDNQAANEGVRVSIGPEGITGLNGPLTFDVLCSAGSRTFTFQPNPTPTPPTPTTVTPTRPTPASTPTRTPTPMPGMPNTGAGGGTDAGVPATAFVLLAGALAATTGAVALRRRRA